MEEHLPDREDESDADHEGGDEQEEESGELGAPITELPKKSNSIKAFMFVLVITPSSTLG